MRILDTLLMFWLTLNNSFTWVVLLANLFFFFWDKSMISILMCRHQGGAIHVQKIYKWISIFTMEPKSSMLPFPTFHLEHSKTVLLTCITPFQRLMPYVLRSKMESFCFLFAAHLYSMTFFHKLLSSFQYLHIYFPWSALFKTPC